MKRKYILFILLLSLAVIVLASWQYRMVCLLVLVGACRPKIVKRWGKTIYRVCIAVMLCLLWISLPNYFQRGRTQLHYLTQTGERRMVPVHLYLANIVFPEKEVMNLGMKLTAIKPISLGRFADNAQRDFWTGRAWGFYEPYYRLAFSGSHSGSFTIAQAWTTITGQKYNAIYITRPKNFEQDTHYPVLFYAHGYLGSWELYQGIFNRLDDCIVVSIATPNLSGIFQRKDIDKCFTQYIPYLESIGYKVDRGNVHLCGLSNGGSAANVAMRYYSDQFKTVTYMSTGVHVTTSQRAKVLMVAGGKDASAQGMPSAEKKLRANGVKVTMLYDRDETHYFIAHQPDKVCAFINKNM